MLASSKKLPSKGISDANIMAAKHMGSNLRYESSRMSVRFLSPAIIAD